MTPIIDHIIAEVDAWTAQDVNGKDGLTRRLESRELDAFAEVIASTNQRPTTQLTADDFRHPMLDDLFENVRREVMYGRGVVVLSGVDVSLWTQDACERAFWGIGQHLGYAAVQSSRGDRIGYVRDEPDDPKRRGYRSSGELVLHTDSREIIALVALRPAAKGGETIVASSSAIHNIILTERPDLLPALYRGYPYHSTEVGVTDCAIPIFSSVDGKLSCMFFEEHIRRAARSTGDRLPPDLDEALEFFASVARRPEVCIEFLLKPGEMIFCNNFVVLHARNKFEDSAETQRLLARLWINVPLGRPTVPELHVRRRWFDEHHDPVLMALHAG
jgi:hypothetical protein